MRDDLKLYVKIYIPNGNGKVAKEGLANSKRTSISNESGIARIAFEDDGKTYITHVSNVIVVMSKE